MPDQARFAPAAVLVAAVSLGIFGYLLIRDRPGLTAEHFANTPSQAGSPIFRDIREPRLRSHEDLGGIFVSQEIFSIRWRGWIAIGESGPYRFSIKADEEAYLRVGDWPALNTQDRSGGRRATAVWRMERGIHEIEIGFAQTGGPSRLRVDLASPDAINGPISSEILFAKRPVRLHSILRRALAGMSIQARRLLGAGVTLAALLLLRVGLRPLGEPAWRFDPRVRRGLRAAFLVALFLATWLATVPFTATTTDGDDIRYMDAAVFNKKMEWNLWRYAHIYLLKPFIWLHGGDAFSGSRAYWSFMLAVTVVSLGLAGQSRESGLGLRTLSVTLFLLFSQTSLFGGIGAAYADFSAMMFITVAVAVYFHSLAVEAERRHEWHALIIGVLTVAALKSKETGLILTWIPLLWLWSQGRFDLRRFCHRLGYWFAGVMGGLAVLMLLDGWLLGDFWFSVRPDSFAAVSNFKQAVEDIHQQSRFIWLEVIGSGHPRGEPVSFALRYLAALVGVGAVVAWRRGVRAELRWLSLMPVAYLVMLVVLHPPVFSPRYLFPIIPISCLVASGLFRDAGLEQLSWRDLTSPRILIPVFAAAALVLLVIAPGDGTGQESSAAIAARALARPPWSVGTTIFVVVTASVALLALGRRTAITVLLVCLAGFFGPGLVHTRSILERHLAVQRGNLVLYPWTVFGAELEAARPNRILVTPQVSQKHQMVGQRRTRDRIARLYFRRPRLRIRQRENLSPTIEYAVGSRRDWRRWREQMQALDRSAVFDPSGQIVLVRPRTGS